MSPLTFNFSASDFRINSRDNANDSSVQFDARTSSAMNLKLLLFLGLLCVTVQAGGAKKKSKVIAVSEAPVSCYDQTLADRNDCMATKPGYNCHFNLKEDDPECAWKCNCIQDIVVKKEKVVRKEEPELNVEKKKIKKLVKKTRAGANEACDGVKKFTFHNCLVDIKGLVGWGKETRNFDSKFKKLLA
jgi:uncharacterized membrane protein